MQDGDFAKVVSQKVLVQLLLAFVKFFKINSTQQFERRIVVLKCYRSSSGKNREMRDLEEPIFKINLIFLLLCCFERESILQENFVRLDLHKATVWEIFLFCSTVSCMTFMKNLVIATNTLVCLYYAPIYPFFIYSLIAWGNTYEPSNVNPLFILQKRAIRIITFSSFTKLKSLKIVKFFDIVKRNYFRFHV